MKPFNLTIKNLKALSNFAKFIVKNLEPGFQIMLEGDLGAGKTTFVSYLVKAIGSKDWVSSPSFTLAQKYTSNINKKNPLIIYHLDLYRLTNTKEIESIDILHYLNNPENILLIEWADKLQNYYPEKYLKIEFHFLKTSSRNLIITSRGKEYLKLYKLLSNQAQNNSL